MSSNLKINFSKFFILNKLIFRFFKFSQGGLTCISYNVQEIHVHLLLELKNNSI